MEAKLPQRRSGSNGLCNSKEMYSKINKKQTFIYIYNTIKNYTEKQTRTVNSLKTKIHMVIKVQLP
jgi:hypothetical protein